jgi:hypothetical protein
MREEANQLHLSAEERDRLRPTVDVGALERFLAVAPRELRQFYFLACANSVTDTELTTLGIELPPLPSAPPPEPSIAITLPDGRQARRVSFRPARNVHFILHHVPDPELDRLWQDVEPSSDRGA